MDGDPHSLVPFFFILILLVLTGSVLSMIRIALSAVSKPKLHSLIETGNKKYQPVLDAAEKSGFHMESLTIGILFLVIISGCLGSIGFSAPLGRTLLSLGMSPNAALVFAILIIACGIMVSFFILGEVILRQLALVIPESVISAMLPVLRLTSILVYPLYLVSRNISAFMNKAFFRNSNRNANGNASSDINRAAAASRQDMTETELYHALLEGEKSGFVESEERTMVEGVFYLGDRPVSAFMTHRSEIMWLDIGVDRPEAREAADKSGSQLFFPVASGDLDEIVGMVAVKDIYRALLSDPWPGLKSIMKPPYFIPETMSALKAFEAFKKADANYLFVMDEYGGFAGILMVRNLIEEIVGELTASPGEEETIVKQNDGTWLADGGVNIDDAAKELGLTRLGAGLGAEQGEYHTLAGFILYLAGEIPKTEAYFDYSGYRFKIVDMDHNRIDKIMISKIIA